MRAVSMGNGKNLFCRCIKGPCEIRDVEYCGLFCTRCDWELFELDRHLKRLEKEKKKVSKQLEEISIQLGTLRQPDLKWTEGGTGCRVIPRKPPFRAYYYMEE